jgi:outer membrane lipoprotein-sorting protein
MTPYDRRTFLRAGGLGLVVGLTPFRPASAALPNERAALIAEVERYFNSLRTIRARFEQIAPDGGYSTGELYLRRPGRLRFDYDPPSKILLIATDWRLIFQDSSIKQVNVVPVAKTPLGFLLADQVSLSGAVSVTDTAQSAEELALTIVRTEEPDQGRVVIVLGKDPLKLRRWSVTDAQGLTTQVILSQMETNVPIDNDLFFWRDPKMFGWPED